MNRYILYLILLAIDVYAFQAVRVWAQNWSASGRTILYVGYWSLTLFAVFMIFSMQMRWTEVWPKGLMVTLRALVFIFYLSKVFMVGVLLIDDLRRLFVWIASLFKTGSTAVDLSRSRFLSQVALVLGGIPLLSLTYGMLRNRYRYQLQEIEVPVADLPAALDGLRIVQISDIHSGSFTATEPQQEAIDLINAQEPDLVFFTGDLVNSVAAEMEPHIPVFSGIESRYGVYSVMGNHDYGDYHDWPTAAAKRENMRVFEATHQQMGWNLLRNEHRLLDIAGERVAVIGVENWSAMRRFPKYGDLAKAYPDQEAAAVRILLSHDPTHWEAEVVDKYPDIDLTLSGHTHGMQFGIEIPGWLKWSPAQYVYKHWAGLYQSGTQSLYVNRGLGFLGYPGRVGILAEITTLTLRRA